MNLQLSAEDLDFQQQVRRFFAEDYPLDIKQKIARGERLTKADQVRSQQALQARGWLGIGWPKAHGGPGWTPVQRYLFEAELELAGAANIIPMGVIYLGPILAAFGSPEQQQRWLPNILNSTHFWAQGYSEPESGSDLASLRTAGVVDGDDYRVSGSKIWTTQGHWADWIFCLVRTSRGARKQEGITFLCIDMRSPGVSVQPIISMNGAHELNRVEFDDVRVPQCNRIGDEGRGWHYANVLLGNERLSYAHIGKKKADMARLRRLASECRDGVGGTMLDDPLFAHKLAAMEVRVAVLEMSVLRGLSGDLPPAAISSLKIQCTECAQGITELFTELAGATAFPDMNCSDWSARLGATPAFVVKAWDDYLFERAQSIYGGTNEIQRTIIWRALAAG